MKPWLSVVMPTYNGAAFVEAALASVRGALESESDVEVIVVDDGSDDGTPTIAESLLPTPQSRVIVSGERAGWVAATNVGIQHATGRWLCMLHQDDMWLPTRLSATEKAIRLNPNAGVVVGATLFVDEFGKPLGTWRLPWRGGIPAPRELARRLYVQNWIGLPSATLRTDLLARIGPLDAALWYSADWDLWLRLVRATRVVATSVPLSCFRIHECSQTYVGSRQRDDFRSQMTSVQQRHRWAADGRPDVVMAGELATATNVALASALHGNPIAWLDFLRPALRLRFSGWHRFVRDSRIVDRTVPRVRLAARSALRGRSL